MPSTWTPEQRRAIETLDRDVCVSAGAGSGKTGVLVERFLHILRESAAGRLPEQARAGVDGILVITFTEKATREMKGRIVTGLSEAGLREQRREIEGAYISTIHGFCSRLLKENPFEIGVDPEFSVLDETEAERMLRAAVEEAVERAFAREDADVKRLIAATQDERQFGTDMSDPLAALTASVRGVMNRLRGAGWTLEALTARWAAGAADASLLAQTLRGAARDLSGRRRCLEEPAGVTGTLEIARREACAQIERLEESARGETFERLEEGLAALRELGKTAQKAVRAKTLNTPAELAIQQEMAAIRQLAEELKGLLDVTAAGEEHAEERCTGFRIFLLESWARYAASKREAGALDNDDLQSEAVRLLESAPGVLARYRRRFRYLLVDEFQDTNPLQLRLIRLLHPHPLVNNLFLVGDVQQSIYGFRNADATIFQDIVREFRRGAGGEAVTLAANFRSRPEVLRGINYLFEQLWTGTGRGADFTPLTPSDGYGPKSGPSLECIVTPDIGRAQYVGLEADAVAGRIRRIVDERELRVSDRRSPRFGEPVEYGDIAILLRGLTEIEKYERALALADIPYFVVGGGRGYYARHEVRDLMNALTVLERPLDDVAVAAALRSPMVGIGLDGMHALSAAAKREGKHGPLYPAVGVYLETAPIGPETARLRAFHECVEELRRKARRLSTGHLLESLIRATEYDARLLVRPNGRRRLANVRKLVQMAHAAQGGTVGEFILRLREIEKISDREGDAPTEEEFANVVRILTVHKAKGLEFPVVFLGDMARSLSFPERGLFTCDAESAALGCKSGEYRSAAYRLTDQARQARELDESVRLLYVAMTRAREHLILCGSTQGRARGPNWADMTFPHLGVTNPEEPELRVAPGGVGMKLWPMKLLAVPA